MADPYSGFSHVSSQGESWATLVPGVGVLPIKPKAIWCGTAGTVTMEGSDGVSVVFTVAAGTVLPFRPNRVTASTVTELIAIY